MPINPADSPILGTLLWQRPDARGVRRTQLFPAHAGCGGGAGPSAGAARPDPAGSRHGDHRRRAGGKPGPGRTCRQRPQRWLSRGRAGEGSVTCCRGRRAAGRIGAPPRRTSWTAPPCCRCGTAWLWFATELRASAGGTDAARRAPSRHGDGRPDSSATSASHQLRAEMRRLGAAVHRALCSGWRSFVRASSRLVLAVPPGRWHRSVATASR